MTGRRDIADQLSLVACHLSLVTVLALGLAGCGGGGKRPEAIRVWHWMTDREEAFEELATRYNRTHTTPVRFELYAPSDLYVQKVRAAAQTDGLPDVFGVLGEMRDFASFANAGHLLSLTEAMNADPPAWRTTFFPIALAMNTFESGNPYGAATGIYGVPIDVMNIQLFYNKRLLAKLGVDPAKPPATWADWLVLGKQANAEGLIGLVSGWAELWLLDCFATNYAVHLMGQKRVEATFRGKVPYTDGGWIAVLELFEQLRDSQLLAEGIVTMINKRAEQLFANEQAVFAFNGTWGVNVYRSMNPDLDYGVMMPPPIRPDRPMVTWGGAGSSFMVNANSPKAQEAVQFLQWLTAPEQQQYLLSATHNIPANQVVASTLSGPLAQFVDDMGSVIHPRLFAVQERATVLESFDKGLQSILIGEATPSEVASAVQEVKTREETRTRNHRNGLTN